MEFLHIGFLLDHHLFDRRNVRRGQRIDRFAKIFAEKPEHVARLRQPGDAARIFGTVEQHLPTVGRRRYLRLAIADAERKPGVRHREFALEVIFDVDIGGVDIPLVRNQAMVERQEHAGLRHPLDEVVRRHDHVVTGVARLEFGEQHVVAVEQVHRDVDAGRFLEIIERVFADISVPIVEIELGFLAVRERFAALLAARREPAEADPDRRDTERLEQRAAPAGLLDQFVEIHGQPPCMGLKLTQ